MQPHSNRLLIVVGATVITWILRVSLAGLACLSNPCLNGICIDDINSSFICFCTDGFTGELCGTNWDECWSSPCENGGSCTDSIATFNCSCPPGFTGEKCEWNVDECASSPCLNGGSCIDQENGFECSCPPGYAGHFCTIDVSVCNISYPMPHIPGPRCYNGGVCLDGPGPNFTCVCVSGWTGARCDVQVDECTSTPCKNGGLCIDLVADYVCACAFGYTGKNCEMTLQMCRGINGSRLNIFGEVTVDNLADENEEDICENGALCLLESNGEKVCYCVPDFHGDRCQFRYDECLLAESASLSGGNASNAVAGGHCQNGGECIDGVDSFSCSCPANFTGHFCECPLFISSESDIDPYCLSTSTEFTSSVTSSSIYPSTSIGTSFFTAGIQPVTTEFVETTEEFVTISPELKTTTKVVSTVSVDSVRTTQDFISTSQETLSTAIDTELHVTKDTGDLTTPSTMLSLSTFPYISHTGISSKETPKTMTDTVTSSTKSLPEFSESSTMSTIRGVVGEDKVWFTEEMTSPTEFPTSTTFTYTKTEPAHDEMSTQGEVATEITVVERQPDSTTFLTSETDKVTKDLSDSFSTMSSQTESTKTEKTPSSVTGSPTYSSDAETTTSTIYEWKDSSTKWIDLATYPEQLSTTESRVEVEYDVTDAETTTIPETTDALITYLYTSDKTIVTPRYITFSDSQTTQEVSLSEEITSTPYKSVDVTDETRTSQPLYTPLTSELPEHFMTSTDHMYPISEVSAETSQPMSTVQTTTEIEITTPLETTSYAHEVSGVFTEITEHAIEISEVTTEEIFPKTSLKTSTYASTVTSLDLSTTPETVPRTHGVSEVDSQTEITSSTETIQGSESTTEISCNVIPCLNGGTCYYNECECTFRFTGTLCEKKKHIEVTSFNGHSYLLHSLNISGFSNQDEPSDYTELENSKFNFKRQSAKSSLEIDSISSNEKSDTEDVKEEYHDIFDEVYDYYEEHTDSYNYSSYDDYGSEEFIGSTEEKDIDDLDLPSTTTAELVTESIVASAKNNLTKTNNVTLDMRNTSSVTENTLVSSTLANIPSPNASYNSDLPKTSVDFSSEPTGTSNPMGTITDKSAIKSSNIFPSSTPTSGNSLRQRGGRSLKRLSSISTSISVKINLQERSLRVGGWGLVMKITLGYMAKASLTINHTTGLLRFHFTCGLGRSLLFGEEDGQRWAGLGRHQPIQSMIIPVLVILEVFPYESVHKNNPSSGRSYLQCAASLKINGQVAVRGQQRAPMPKKSSAGKESTQYLLHLGGIPEMLLPCIRPIKDSEKSVKENVNNYDQKDHDDEEEGFIGCMQDLKINGVEREIFEDALDGHGITECGEKILTGKELERDDNPCFLLPCYGSSTCEPIDNQSWRCRCPTGWLGANCDQSVCDNNPCLYGATCLQDDVGGFICLCPLGKGGRLCENDLEVKKPCFDSGYDWDIEEHQPYIAYPLDHNHLSSPQLVFKFKFSPTSINQIGLLAYIGDLKLPKSLQPSLLSELKDSYLETTTLPTISESSHLTEYPMSTSKDLMSPLPPTVSPQEDLTSPATSDFEQSSMPTLEDTTSDVISDFLPPLDIPLFQDDVPPYLQNFTSAESFNSYSNYIFSPFAPYPYYVRQNGRDHMAVSYIRGHLVLTWDLGSGPRRIFTNKPIPTLYDDNVDKDPTENQSFQSMNPDNYSRSVENATSPSNSSKETVYLSRINFNSSQSESNSKDSSTSEHGLENHQSHKIGGLLSSKGAQLLHSQSEENPSKIKPTLKVTKRPLGHDSPPSERNEPDTDHKISTHNKSYGLKETESTDLSSVLPVPDVSSLPEITIEKQIQETDFNSQEDIASVTKDYVNEVEETNSFPYEDSIPPPPFTSTISDKISPSPSPDHYHEVTIWREGQQAWLKVGDQVVRGQSPGQHYQLNAHRPFLYIGGHDASNVSSLPHDIPLHSSFSGCIFDYELRFGGGHPALNKRMSMFSKGRGVGECGQDPCKKGFKTKGDKNQCLNGGRCIPRGPTFICHCQKSWFGPLCGDSGHNPCDEGIHSCKSGSTCVTLPFGGYKCDCLPGTHGLFCEKDAPIGWAAKLTGIRSFLGVRVPFRGWRKQPHSSSLSDKPKREAFCIDLEIKPSLPNSGGIVLFVMGSDKDEFLSLSINKKGDPELRIGPGSSRMIGPLVIGFNGKFQREDMHQGNENPRTRRGKNNIRIPLPGWRKIRIFRRGQRVFLAMDGLLYGAGTLDSPSQNLPTIRPYNNSVGSSLPLLYLGGLPDLAMLPQDAVGDVMIARPFAGCIRNLAVDWQRVPLGEGSGSYGRNAFSC